MSAQGRRDHWEGVRGVTIAQGEVVLSVHDGADVESYADV